MKWFLSYIFLVAVAAKAADVDILAKDDMDSESLGLAGWTQIANVVASSSCPSRWSRKKAQGKYFCQGSSTSSGCYAVSFPVPSGTTYNKIAGYVRGYQKGGPDGFQSSDYYGISAAYVDGVSITMGSPRQHIWTYAAGYSIEGYYMHSNCPCAVLPGPDPPSFVGQHYYCQSGSKIYPSNSKYYLDAPLWQGTGCTDVQDNCCANLGLPYFQRELVTNHSESIDVRICTTEGFTYEGVLVDRVMLYVKND